MKSWKSLETKNNEFPLWTFATHWLSARLFFSAKSPALPSVKFKRIPFLQVLVVLILPEKVIFSSISPKGEIRRPLVFPFRSERKTIIERNIGGYPFLLSAIKIQINEIKNKVKDLNSKSDFFDLSNFLKLNELYDSLREKFMGLVIKFFVINIEPLTFKVNDLDKLEIDQIILNKDDKENKMNDFINSAQSDLIYKNDIIKYNKYEIGQIKTIILLDYFIKISKTDKNRLYFEINDKEQQKSKKEIDFEELFNYIKIIDNDKEQVNKLKNETNNIYKIIPFSELKKYISINENKISKLFGKELNSVILYNLFSSFLWMINLF